jgi:3-oxoacyl-[acyl-carrier-protein] synthase II
VDRKRAKRLDRFGHFCVACAKLALDDAGIDLAKENRERIGAMMGSALGGISYAEEQFGVFLTEGIDRVQPQLALNVFVGAASCNVAIEFGLQGPNSTNGMSCASGTIGVGDAFRLIRDDYADGMVCGGVEAPLMPLCFGAFTILRAMSTRNDDPEHASRPFDRSRDGFVMGEGGTVLFLEEYERAKARGAHIYAEVVGYGNSNDAHHMTAPRPDASQAARAMRLALAAAHVAPQDVNYVNAHGSSTPLNDPTETAAIRLVFGEHANKLQVSSTKAYYGHALGASGAFELAICAMALERKWLPPTLNLDDPGDGCDLDYIPKRGRDTGVEYILSNSFGFGGINAAVVLRRAD